MSIHSEHPFATPEGERSPVRRLRGRLAAPVTLWTAGVDSERAGLPVSSVLVVDGEPGRLLGILDPESDVYSALTASGRFAVTVLESDQQRIADEFADVVPVPGGAFRNYGWEETQWGPVLTGASAGASAGALRGASAGTPAGALTWAGCRLVETRPFGWGYLVEAVIEFVELGEGSPLVYYRGRYRTVLP